MFQTLIVGLGRSGRRLHFPIVSRARRTLCSRYLTADRPIVAVDLRPSNSGLPGALLADSLHQAADITEPESTVVHLCTAPTDRVAILKQLARLGFRKILVEKPLALDEGDLHEIVELRRRRALDLVVVAPWLASTLTHRMRDILVGGDLGALESISVVQRKPRFTRSVSGQGGHPTAFDIEMPHSVGVAIALAGNGRVRDAGWEDMRFDDVLLPRMGAAWLRLDHDCGVRTEIFSDLTSPTRERRITVGLEGGTLIGHYSVSDADNSAQLITSAGEHTTRAVFRDDSLTNFVLQAYEHFAGAGQGGDGNLGLNAEVVRLLAEGKARARARSRSARHSKGTFRSPPSPRPGLLQCEGSRKQLAEPMSAALHEAPSNGAAVTYAGIGDEAGASLRAQLNALARLGWNALELRTIGGRAIADLDERGFARLADALSGRGIEIPCVASRIGNWSRAITGGLEEDLHELDILSRRCAALGTRYIRVMSYLDAGLPEREWGRRVVERFRALIARAERAGVVLLHENCTGWAASSSERMLELLDAIDSPALRLLFDTGNGIAYGYEAHDLLQDVVGYVAHVHVKDAEGTAAEPVYTLAGAGRARVADCLRTLLAGGYTGAFSIEPHLAVRPHNSGQDSEADVAGGPDAFVACGRALERVVREQVLPALHTCQRADDGIARSGR